MSKQNNRTNLEKKCPIITDEEMHCLEIMLGTMGESEINLVDGLGLLKREDAELVNKPLQIVFEKIKQQNEIVKGLNPDEK